MTHCWGDNDAFGQAGYRSTYPPPNTDPRLGTAGTLRSMTTDVVAAPGATARDAEAVAQRLDAPLKIQGPLSERLAFPTLGGDSERTRRRWPLQSLR